MWSPTVSGSDHGSCELGLCVLVGRSSWLRVGLYCWNLTASSVSWSVLGRQSAWVPGFLFQTSCELCLTEVLSVPRLEGDCTQGQGSLDKYNSDLLSKPIEETNIKPTNNSKKNQKKPTWLATVPGRVKKRKRKKEGSRFGRLKKGKGIFKIPSFLNNA